MDLEVGNINVVSAKLERWRTAVTAGNEVMADCRYSVIIQYPCRISFIYYYSLFHKQFFSKLLILPFSCASLSQGSVKL